MKNTDPIVPVTYVFIKDYEFDDRHFHYNFTANYSLIIPELTAITDGIKISTNARPHKDWYGINIELRGLNFIDLRIIKSFKIAQDMAFFGVAGIRAEKYSNIFNSINEFILENIRSYLKYHEKH